MERQDHLIIMNWYENVMHCSVKTRFLVTFINSNIALSCSFISSASQVAAVSAGTSFLFTTINEIELNCF